MSESYLKLCSGLTKMAYCHPTRKVRKSTYNYLPVSDDFHKHRWLIFLHHVFLVYIVSSFPVIHYSWDLILFINNLIVIILLVFGHGVRALTYTLVLGPRDTRCGPVHCNHLKTCNIFSLMFKIYYKDEVLASFLKS